MFCSKSAGKTLATTYVVPSSCDIGRAFTGEEKGGLQSLLSLFSPRPFRAITRSGGHHTVATVAVVPALDQINLKELSLFCQFGHSSNTSRGQGGLVKHEALFTRLGFHLLHSLPDQVLSSGKPSISKEFSNEHRFWVPGVKSNQFFKFETNFKIRCYQIPRLFHSRPFYY